MSTEIAKPAQAPTSLAVPDYAKGDGQRGESLSLLQQYVRPPRLKIVQRTSDAMFELGFKDGDGVLVPNNTKFTEMGQVFHFVPVFFFPEWLECSPWKLRGSEPYIRNRSIDPTSVIARYAKDVKRREQPHPKEPSEKITFVESLTFIVMLLDTPAAGVPAVMSFARGEWKSGQSLGNLIMGRKTREAFANVFAASICKNPRKNDKGSWRGFDITNPNTAGGFDPFVSKDQYDMFRAINADMCKAHKENAIIVDHDDEDTLDAEVVHDSRDTEY